MVAIEMCQRASPPAGVSAGPSASRGSSASRQGAEAGGMSGGGSGNSEAEGRAREGIQSAGPTRAAPAGKAPDDFDDDGDLDLSASLWFQTLDKILSAKGAASRGGGEEVTVGGGHGVGGVAIQGSRGRRRRGGELPQTAAVMGGVLDALLRRTLSSMAGYVPLPVIVRKVLSDHAGSSLGEFRHVILAMLDTYSYDTAIHRTAASLLFESLRGVVRERHTLKGAGIRVDSVAGQELPTRRLTTVAAAPTEGRSKSPPPAGDVPDAHDDAKSTGLGFSHEASTTAAASPQPPPAALLEAVGSGVISVSPGGVALIEHLGRKGAAALGGGDTDSATSGGDLASRSTRQGAPGESLSAVADRGGGGRGGQSGASSEARHDASASLWRLRAARRRRKVRGDKMRSLVTWAAGRQAGDDGMTGAGSSGVSERGSRVVRGGRDDRSGGVRTAGMVRPPPPPPPPPPAVGRPAVLGGSASATVEREEAVGWGVKLQARAARAIPASFLTKRL
ncbi:unnamed protein product [Sphacelaria rigidula]